MSLLYSFSSILIVYLTACLSMVYDVCIPGRIKRKAGTDLFYFEDNVGERGDWVRAGVLVYTLQSGNLQHS